MYCIFFSISKHNKSVNLIYFLYTYHIHDKEISLPFEYHLHLARRVEANCGLPYTVMTLQPILPYITEQYKIVYVKLHLDVTLFTHVSWLMYFMGSRNTSKLLFQVSTLGTIKNRISTSSCSHTVI